MKRITERDLILPALYVIDRQPGIATSELIIELRSIFRPTGMDAELLQGRNDDRFSQIVRNLVSHHTLDGRLGYTALDTSGGSNAKHTITPIGKEFLQKNSSALESLLSNEFDYQTTIDAVEYIHASSEEDSDIIILDENVQIKEGKRKTVTTKVYERSRKLRDRAIEYYSRDGTIVCRVCGFDYYQTYGELGKGFIEVHHRRPIYQYEEEMSSKSLIEAIQDVVPLCSNCHKMIHRNKDKILSVEELKIIITSHKPSGE